MTTLAYLQWVERKVIAHIQVRLGPSRVGPHGLLQPLADVIKLITKEDLIPPHVNKLLLPAGAVPGRHHGADFDLGHSVRPEITIFGYTHLDAAHRSEHRRAVHPGAVARWASTASRWPAGLRTISTALLGGLRSSAQMISYELPMSLAIAAPLLIAEHAEPARDGRMRRRATISASFRAGTSSRCRSRRSSASSFS